MRSTLISVILLSCFSPAFTQTKYYGKLERETVFHADHLVIPREKLSLVPPDGRKGLPLTLGVQERVFANSSRSVILVESEGREPYLWLDSNADGLASDDEKVAFSRLKEPVKSFDGKKNLTHAAVVRGPFAPGSFLTTYTRPYWYVPEGAESRTLYSPWVTFARGRVNLDGRELLVEYAANKDFGKILFDGDWIAMDCNQDGKIDARDFSKEMVPNQGKSPQPPVFKVGDRYLSTQTLEERTGDIVLREHLASEYAALTLQIGQPVEDFVFTDLKSKERRLSDFKGRYLLIDFWGTWCGPCVGEIPFLKEAYAEFKDRGFEILGVNNEYEGKTVKSLNEFLSDQGITWQQASVIIPGKGGEMNKRLLVEGFRVYRYPTVILIGPDGKVVSVDQDALRGTELAKTLRKLMLTN